jgi:NAD(P)-dependent dehydrogenase (short-subunit alcohol dehydrogenase family)
MEIAGKTAIITGGGGSIGGAIAEELARKEVNVAVTDFDLARAVATAAKINLEIGEQRAMGLRLDVTSQADFDAARSSIAEQFGPVDIIVSNAGVGHSKMLGDMSAEAFAWVQDVNLNASIRALSAFLPQMKERGDSGHILFTSSITALRPFPGQSAYTSAKAALLNLAMVLEMELRGSSIGVSVLCPGVVATNLRKNAEAAKPREIGEAMPTGFSAELLSHGMSPAAVAAAAVEAIEQDDFYIFPHPDYRDVIAAEQKNMLEAMSMTAQPGYQEPEMFLAPIR